MNDVDADASVAGVPFADLIAKARAGDPAAAGELLAASQSYLGVLAKARMQPWMAAKLDASDLVQQTMCDAHAHLDVFAGEGEGQWKAYLKRILQNNVQDIVRQYRGAEKRDVTRERSTEQADGTTRPLAADDPTPSRVAADDERDLELAAAIDQLPPDYREVILARNVRKEPFSEIAERLGRSEAATQMLWTRAIRRLKADLDGRSELAD